MLSYEVRLYRTVATLFQDNKKLIQVNLIQFNWTNIVNGVETDLARKYRFWVGK